MATCSLLDLPFEIRRIIYAYCYVPPYDCRVSNSYPTLSSWIPSNASDADDDVVLLYDSPKPTNQKCQHANSHLSAIQVNRQIREELYPFFAASHTLNFPDPLEFANHYLSYMPSRSIQSLRSLNLTWQIRGKCSSALPARRSGPKLVDVKSQLHKVMQLLETYPELLTALDRFGFTLPRFCDYSHNHCGALQVEMRADLMRLSVMLCEKINELLRSSSPVIEEQRFLIEVARPNSWYFTLWRVPEPIFNQINDQDIIMKGNCPSCRTACQDDESVYPGRHDEHEGIFESLDEIVQAVQDDKRWNPPLSRQYDLSVHKKWKAIFHPSGPRRSWNVNLRYLEARREGSLLTNSSRKRKRSTKGVESSS